MTEKQYPFKSATAAIVHAFNDERRGGARPASARLADKRLAEPPEFGGVDGSVEKAVAAAMLAKGLSRVQFAALQARYAPRQRRCPCCNQHVWRDDWLAALRTLAEAVAPLVDMPSVRSTLLTALVQRHYEGSSKGLDRLASEHSVSVSTVSRANSIVLPWLRGSRKGKDGASPVEGIDQAAFALAEEVLRSGGFIQQ